MSKITCLWDAKAELGERVRYDAIRNEVWWVDILGQKIFCLSLNTGKKSQWDTPETVGRTFSRQNDEVLALFKNSLVRLNLDTNDFEPLVNFPEEPKNNRFNDGTLAPDGSIWVGSMDFDCKLPTGNLYRVSSDFKQTEIKDSSYIVLNGPAFTHKGDRLYVNETMLGEIYSYDVDSKTGDITNKQLFSKFTKDEGLPDGVCVDSNDRLWVAIAKGGRVRRYLPDGGIDLEINLPSPVVTSVCIGGVDSDILFVTTGRILMDEEMLKAYPLSGSLFSIDIKDLT